VTVPPHSISLERRKNIISVIASHLLRNREPSIWGAPCVVCASMSAHDLVVAQLRVDLAAERDARDASRLDTERLQRLVVSLNIRVKESIQRVEDLAHESPYDLDGSPAESL